VIPSIRPDGIDSFAVTSLPLTKNIVCGFQIIARKVILTRIDRNAHYLTAIPGDTQTPGARDFGNQLMRVAAAKDTADPGTLLLRIIAASDASYAGARTLSNTGFMTVHQ
jgi:hypothetical protein